MSFEIIPRSTAGSCRTNTRPSSSNPRRPARPAIWINSCSLSKRLFRPSNLNNDSNNTECAGPFTPTATVSVEISTGMIPLQYKISMISFTYGTTPA
ncbi:hypothetical protein NY2A_b318L [Paramecium bursaria Chlorella virus NY2A]|uniref:Uncharacterized protein b318L n=1 Tax=Paramecium bursaria Chlorella virus NY2A TaxID=46021 RepID=A7IWJ3_PBCVN|nr:hypothetical protein NY2A_b318L [Paramecium bursaria Chlorella virus NY2A]YP_001498375.1 hypothetical protein AR158_c294L [Paramecium bursaria Chlorella virus AR158]ABT14717.1 hypothetical protein NY2A_b318L [Paramecium bursaria Chlorella virus NY2A]ABU43839.1 hypothetical protein AR158_c294L [Paramecium bursaria Chlorella virus AR158]